jgi:hypothetical protein
MTYEELLADIESKNYRESRTLDTPYAALRAVVELHKPNGDECLVCEKDNNGDWGWEIYPCPTIQAIEKELA